MPMRDESGNRIYVGNLVEDCRESELRNYFEKAGRIDMITMKRNYAFIDYVRRSDLQYAIDKFNQSNFCGRRILVEEARGIQRESRSGFRGSSPSYGGSSGRYEGHQRENGFVRNAPSSRGYPPKNSKKLSYRILVLNLPINCEWNDLKDHMKAAGDVNYVSCHEHITTVAIVEFDRSKDIKKAVEMFDNSTFMGNKIRVIDPKNYTDSNKKSSSHSNGNNYDDNVSLKSLDKYSKSRSRSPVSRRSLSRGSDDKQSRKRYDSDKDDELEKRSRSFSSEARDDGCKRSKSSDRGEDDRASDVGTPSKQAKYSSRSRSPSSDR